MLRKKQASLPRPPVDKRIAFWKAFYTTTALVGCIAMILEIRLYNWTMISAWIPTYIILVVGLIAYAFNHRHLRTVYPGIFYALLLNILSWGGMAGYLFMAVNYYGASGATYDYIFKVKQAGVSGRHRTPYVRFDYLFKFEKELVVPSSDERRIWRAERVFIRIKHGSLGFDAIQYYDVIEKPEEPEAPVKSPLQLDRHPGYN